MKNNDHLTPASSSKGGEGVKGCSLDDLVGPAPGFLVRPVGDDSEATRLVVVDGVVEEIFHHPKYGPFKVEIPVMGVGLYNPKLGEVFPLVRFGQN